MQVEPKDFVHVLLFKCANCGLPVVNAVPSDSKNLEEIDLDYHDVACECGWSGQAYGLEARRHWVESWHEAPLPDRHPG
jgi:hypothetical protein